MMKATEMQSVKIYIPVILLMVTLVSCGHYSTTGRSTGDIKSIAVPYLGNDTSEPEVEIEITEEIINGLIDDGTLRVVSEDEGDAVLEGSVIEYSNEPTTFNRELQADQYRLAIKLKVSLFNRKENDFIWEDKIITARSNYYLEGSTNQTYEKAQEEVYLDIVELILGATVQEW